jgi:hypothetical protein
MENAESIVENLELIRSAVEISLRAHFSVKKAERVRFVVEIRERTFLAARGLRQTGFALPNLPHIASEA